MGNQTEESDQSVPEIRWCGSTDRPVSWLETIQRAELEFSVPLAQSHFDKRDFEKALAVTALLRWDNCARTRRVVHWSQSLRNQTQLTALDICAAKQRLLHDLPPPKKKTKRNRPDNCSVPIAACHRATGVAPITSTATVLPVLPSSSSSEDDDGDSDDSNDSDSNEKRQFSNKRYYYRNYPPYSVIFYHNLHCSIIVNLTGSFSFYA